MPRTIRRAHATRGAAVLARLAVLVTAIGAIVLVGRTVGHRAWPDPEPRLPTASSSAARTVLADLRRQGVLPSPDQQRALRALLGVWTRRREMHRTMALSDGTPDLRRLLSWSAGTTDPTASVLADFRGDLLELQYRMGIPDGTGNVIPVLRWYLRNRTHPVIPADNAILVVASVWNERPELADQFLIDGRIDVRGLIWWCANVRKDDPDYWTLARVTGDLQRLSAELPPRPLGRNW